MLKKNYSIATYKNYAFVIGGTDNKGIFKKNFIIKADVVENDEPIEE